MVEIDELQEGMVYHTGIDFYRLKRRTAKSLVWAHLDAIHTRRTERDLPDSFDAESKQCQHESVLFARLCLPLREGREESMRLVDFIKVANRYEELLDETTEVCSVDRWTRPCLDGRLDCDLKETQR